MRRLWHDFRAHRRAAVLFFLYWLATLAVERWTFQGGIPGRIVVLLLTTPLIAGALVGWWRGAIPERAHRSRDRITGGMLAGVLSAEITLVVAKGGLIDEVIGGMRGNPFEGGEVVEWLIFLGVLGALLGSAGAALAMILDRVRHQSGGLRPHHDRS